MVVMHKTEGTRADIITVMQRLALNELYTHHVAWRRGYVSRKSDANGLLGYMCEYNGRYGHGYIWHLPDYESTMYHRVMYIIEREG